jgi:hypothetical protein
MKVVNSQWKNLSPRMRLKNKTKKKLDVYEYFSTMAENSTSMLQQFVETNVLFRNMDARLDIS